jgi:tRNA G18 (ribose-2'-O)-methylase SpoU
VVQRLLASNLDVVSILITESWLPECRYDLERRPEPVTVYVSPVQLLKGIVGFNYHQGIMAVGKVPPPIPLPDLCTSRCIPQLFVAFDFLSSTENSGVILRNCAACGVTAILSGPTSTDPYLRRSVRNSMGNIFKLAVHYSDDLAQTLTLLRREYGFTVTAAHLSPGSVSMHKINFTGNHCIVFGNEQHGVSGGVLDICDNVAVIPMQPGVDSYNVGCASAIMLHEAFRQRTCR